MCDVKKEICAPSTYKNREDRRTKYNYQHIHTCNINIQLWNIEPICSKMSRKCLYRSIFSCTIEGILVRVYNKLIFLQTIGRYFSAKITSSSFCLREIYRNKTMPFMKQVYKVIGDGKYAYKFEQWRRNKFSASVPVRK